MLWVNCPSLRKYTSPGTVELLIQICQKRGRVKKRDIDGSLALMTSLGVCFPL